MGKKFFFIFLVGVQAADAFSQNYHAVQGSSYAGSLGVGNNPASIVNTPYPWDITIFGTQEKHSTNALTIYKYSLISSPGRSEYLFNTGNYSRYAHANFNVNLLNARFALGREKAIAFGMNVRSYSNVTTGPYNFIDTLSSMRQFFDLGNSNVKLQGDVTSSSWMELYGTYSQTIWDRETNRLNAGVTLKVSRGLSGAHGAIQNLQVRRTTHNDETVYRFESGEAQYGYSANFDTWKDERSTSQNLRDFITHTAGGISIDLGVEYILKPPGLPAWDEEAYYDYDWKIGVALLDLGFNQFKYGLNSRKVAGIRPGIYDTLADDRLNGVESFEAFNDTLATLVSSMGNLRGDFKIINPARLVVNVDHYLFDAFHINGDLSINLSPLAGKRLHVTEQNLLTITPRWEIKSLGVYLPMMVNSEGKFWVGGAFKVGPLLLGIHNWANIFSKTKMQNSGGYIAFVVRPGNLTSKRGDKRYECPE